MTMTATLSDEIAELFHHAEKHLLVTGSGTDTVLDRAGIERHLPQRDPFMFLDRVTMLDVDRRMIVAHYDLARAEAIFTGHFPGRPLFPGVLQIETIGQAGIVLGRAEGHDVADFALTHVLAARFIRPVPPGGEVEVIAHSLDDGLFRTIVGQIVRDGQICSVAAVSGVDGPVVTDLFETIAADPMMETITYARSNGIYPYFLPLEESEGTEVVMDGRRLVMAGANNYLGLAGDPRVVEAAMSAIARYGTSCTGSRFMNGTLAMHLELERRLAAFIGKEAALVFATGYQSNLGAITALMNDDHVAVCDKEIHASIIDAVRMSGAELARFRHNDPEALDQVLNENFGRPAMVLVDGVYSMGGDLAQLPEIIDVARGHGARVFVDDAHGLGVVGPGSRGTAAHFGCVPDVDIVMGTFSKALASVGGVIAGSAEVIEYVRHNARSLLFSAALPPASTAATLAALDVLENEPNRPTRAHQHAQRVRHELRALGYDCGASQTPIVPVLVGEEFDTIGMWKALIERGVYTNPVVTPAVPPGRGILRTSYMAAHTDDQVNHIIAAFRDLRQRAPE